METVVNIKDEIYEDLYRYSKLRSWFRSLPAEGVTYLIFPWRGQQPKNPIHSEVEDGYGMHWWVWEADYIDEIPIDGIGKDIIMRRPIKFNCFLRGLDGELGYEYLKGWDVICNKYPEVKERLSGNHHKKHRHSPEEYADYQHKKQLRNATKTAYKIYKLMKKHCPNWLNIPMLRRTKSDYISYAGSVLDRKKRNSDKSSSGLFHQLSDKLLHKRTKDRERDGSAGSDESHERT